MGAVTRGMRALGLTAALLFVLTHVAPWLGMGALLAGGCSTPRGVTRSVESEIEGMPPGVGIEDVTFETCAMVCRQPAVLPPHFVLRPGEVAMECRIVCVPDGDVS